MDLEMVHKVHRDSIHLPIEMLEELFEYLDVNDLFTCRLANKIWNEAACVRIRQIHQPINVLHDDENLLAFISTMECRIQSGIPYSSFEFQLSRSISLEVLECFCATVGQFSIKYFAMLDYDIMSVDLLNMLLCYSPCLEILEVKVDKVSTFTILQPLLKLKSLSVLPKETRFHVIIIPIILNWIQMAPALRHLECGFELNTRGTDQELYPNPRAPIDYIGLILPASRAGGSTMTKFLECIPAKSYGLELIGSPYIDWIEIQVGDKLKSLNLYFHHDMDLSLCNFPALVVFKLDTIGSGIRPFVNPFTHDNFPVLKTVILKSYLYKTHHIKFFKEFATFPMVENLYFVGTTHRMEFKLDGEPFHEIFPNLKSFGMKGVSSGGHLIYAITKFPNIVSLTFLNFSEANDTGFSILTGGIPQKKVSLGLDGEFIIRSQNFLDLNHQSPFTNLKQLRTLEFGSDKTNGLLFALTCLTAFKKLQQLEYLGIYASNDHANEVTGKLWISKLKSYNWHKNISSDWRRSPTSCELMKE